MRELKEKARAEQEVVVLREEEEARRRGDDSLVVPLGANAGTNSYAMTLAASLERGFFGPLQPVGRVGWVKQETEQWLEALAHLCSIRILLFDAMMPGEERTIAGHDW